jgi:inner membrane protein involved in colicin E2 resistance
VLFLVPVFTTFFLFEVTGRQKIHPLQYLMVGAVLCCFYLLLLSISEFIGFSWAYLIAAVASWRRARTLVIGQSRRRLQISLYHFAAAGLRIAHGRDRTLHRTGDRNARNAQS